jgi:hypothetical protein
VWVLNLDKGHLFLLAELNKVILQVHLRLLEQNIRFFGSLALHLHEEAVVNIWPYYTVLIYVRPIFDVFQVPVVKIGIVEIGVNHGEAESLIAEEVVDLLLWPARLFRCRIQTFLQSYL